ncbi:tetratricopeptide repeat protein [Uliginosibacterium sediminicola]|uniref:Tetratricopeptide repeat protein n=1 Tax=Uliginosibacterium sediminicola TaxID=2024550 RepID=A0ABU9Z3A4_9RHOO
MSHTRSPEEALLFKLLRTLFASPAPAEQAHASSAEDLKQRGNAHFNAGQLDAAAACYRQAIALDPQLAAAYNNLAAVLQQQGELEQARQHATQAIVLAPNLSQAHFKLGEITREQGDYAASVAHFRHCLALQADDEPSLLALAHSLCLLGAHDEAEALLHDALLRQPQALNLHYYLGNIYKERGAPQRALAEYAWCLEQAPDLWPAQMNSGLACWELGDLGSARTWLQQAAADPTRTEAQLALGELLLLQGELEAGFALLEQRFESQQPAYRYIRETLPRLGGVPLWQGEALAGRNLLLWAEQGLGDTLMMLRYLPELRRQGAGQLLVFCQPHVLRLIEASGLADAVCSLAGQARAFAGSAHHYALHCPLMSLPQRLGSSNANIPANPPLQLPANLLASWQQRLAHLAGHKVGLVWAGNPQLKKDALRSIPLAHFSALAEVPGLQLISLQKSEARAQIADSGLPLHDWMDDCADMLDTAALISQLDLVISVDTSVAHLAGLLGKPVWLLNRHESEWRWQLERQDSPWYPSMRIFRQHSVGDWHTTIKEVQEALLAPTR